MVEEEGVVVIPSDSPPNPDCFYPMECSFVLDISSDEEGSGLLEDEPRFTGSDDFDWLAEILRDEPAASPEDSDEVVVVKEVNVKSKSKISRLALDDDDDDCVILESDPDKPVAASDGSPGDGSSDDLLIVGETGQVACRDYPHSRHLCFEFPFSNTSHEKHCNLCHCYVCDLPAPCVFWGTGDLNADHCHATDREELWRDRRKQSKGEKTSPAPSVKLPNCSIPVVPQLTRAPLPLGLTHIVANCIPNSSNGTLRPCSTSTTSAFCPVDVAAGNEPHSRLALQPQVIRVHGINAQRSRTHKNGTQSTLHSVSSVTAFKRNGPDRTSVSMKNGSQRTTSRHAWALLDHNLNRFYVQKNPTSRQSVLPGARVTQCTNLTSFPTQPVNVSSNTGPSPSLNGGNIYQQGQPPTHPVIANATCGWSNDLSQSLPQPLPAQSLGGNSTQLQTGRSESVYNPNLEPVRACSLTAAEIESWLLEDLPHQDVGGTLPFDFGNLL